MDGRRDWREGAREGVPWEPRAERAGPWGSGGEPGAPGGQEAEPVEHDEDVAFAGAEEATWALVGQDEEIVAGRRPVEEAFAARREARRLLVVPQRREALETLVLQATRLRIPVVEVEGGTLTSVTGFDGHQGVALVVAPRRWASLDDVLALAATRSEPPFVLVLDSLEDPQNLGTLLRSADACGIHGVVFPTHNAAPLTPSAVKASAGAVEHLLLVPVDDLPGALADLRARGMHLVGTDAEAPLSYRDADLRGPVALVIGSEGKGMTGPVRRRLELLVRIPMRGHVGSLNAAVAGSVLLFEAAAQRPAPPPEDIRSDPHEDGRATGRPTKEAPGGGEAAGPAAGRGRKPPATRSMPAKPDRVGTVPVKSAPAEGVSEGADGASAGTNDATVPSATTGEVSPEPTSGRTRSTARSRSAEAVETGPAGSRGAGRTRKAGSGATAAARGPSGDRGPEPEADADVAAEASTDLEPRSPVPEEPGQAHDRDAGAGVAGHAPAGEGGPEEAPAPLPPDDAPPWAGGPGEDLLPER